MNSVKGWWMHKTKHSLNIPKLYVGNDNPLQQMHSNVLTPNSIPEFTIPGMDTRSQDSASSTSSGVDSFPCSINTSPARSPTGRVSPYNLCVRQTHSAPVSPIGVREPCLSSGGLPSAEELRSDDTNADPFSVSAMTLPHFRTKTSYGFTTLLETPHTRRKESLFHDSDSSPSVSPFTTRALRHRVNIKPDKKTEENTFHKSDTSPLFEYRHSDENLSRNHTGSLRIRRHHALPLGALKPGNGSDSDISLKRSPPPTISPRRSPEFSPIQQRQKRSGLYQRRRSSLVLPENTGKCISTSGKEKDKNSRIPNRLLFRRSSLPGQSLEYSLSSPCDSERLQRLIAEFGEAKISVQYLSDTKQLKVVLVKGENIGGQSKHPNNVNTFAKLYLCPGKLQKQTSKVVKRTRDPEYNEVFYFKDLSLEELQEKSLKIKFYNKTHNLRRLEYIGDLELDLSTVNLQEETRMWMDLQAKQDVEGLGILQIATCFEPKTERLTLTVKQARDLPKQSISGYPDPYVKVEVTQPGRPPMKEQTRARKGSRCPVYNASFVFHISPKFEDLNYTTVTLTVYDHQNLRSDIPLGQICLGYGSTEDLEMSYWATVLQSPDHEFKEWLDLNEVQKHST
ncbi:synaptotagmin-7 [Lingula anatina]|uniref:Synaptotagmin-7 n=1 Tax=Lingula anatina TaxID=7574 RepID=A0A1S3INL5_LINAN|nr:synaptotagmin-7 [Lingula anatina]XP_013399490.1 synaptotagmin-7 [Lingula anatina]XP_013399491.1 synaptotagmin-7 [Lingula anatina]XP_013399492.1 synaptotagmin-7 [Lingula anatina]|eukprot:XP_013399488.1 synaptotagmin-7 [Lingula anatina]